MNNPQAFPMTWVKQEAPNLNVILEQRGMTMRDYFAAKAMEAIICRADNRFTTTLEFVGAKAYQYADAMLKAREQ